MRREGLVLIDERRRLVEMLVDVVEALVQWRRGVVTQNAVGARLIGGPRQQHEVGRAARDEERIVGLERDEDGAAATFLHEVETVVEELAEEHEPEVERRGQAGVRRRVWGG